MPTAEISISSETSAIKALESVSENTLAPAHILVTSLSLESDNKIQ